MTTIKLNAGAILSFDGDIVEHFYGADSKRTHIGTLHDIQIETDKKGKHWLRINANLQPGESIAGAQLIQFDEKVLDSINKMVAEIQKAVSSFRADNE